MRVQFYKMDAFRYWGNYCTQAGITHTPPFLDLLFHGQLGEDMDISSHPQNLSLPCITSASFETKSIGIYTNAGMAEGDGK